MKTNITHEKALKRAAAQQRVRLCKKGVGCAIGGVFSLGSPPNKAFAADGLDSPLFGVDFGTLSRSYRLRSVAAAEMPALGG